MAAPLTLGISPCPNDTFVFHALAHRLVAGAPAVEVTFADIDECNALAAKAALDVVKVSYGALPWLLADYALLPAGGALGRGCGPLVLSGRPGTAAADLSGAHVAVPGERTTAYLLLRLWAAAQVPGGLGAVTVLPFEQVMPAVQAGEVDAGLVIHESRFTFSSYGLHQVADLGAWWEADTGLAIPLGAVVARRELGPQRLRELAAAVRASVEAGWADPAASRRWVAEHAQETAPEVVDAHIALYVTAATADLGAGGYAAVEGLLTRAAAAGITPPVDPADLRLPR